MKTKKEYDLMIKFANKALFRSGQLWQESFSYYMDEAEKIWTKLKQKK